MLICRQLDLIEVRRLQQRGRGGRGVFARANIPAGTLLERSPVILMPRTDAFPSGGASVSPEIGWYVFDWKELAPREHVALALGYGSLFNHSFNPNAGYTLVAPDMIDFHAVAPIAAGEEIFINYHGQPRPSAP